ncbi:MAG: DUF4190 domain-containing protein [Lachnospiraceae bacterium]|nr:DUF4190 domain-containing protein [Lachnospiraceae bacterium]
MDNNLQTQHPQKKGVSAIAIISLILGVIGMFTSCFILGIVIAIPGFILGFIAVVMKKKPFAVSILGLISSSIGLLIFVGWIILFGVVGVEPAENTTQSQSTTKESIPNNDQETALNESETAENETTETEPVESEPLETETPSQEPEDTELTVEEQFAQEFSSCTEYVSEETAINIYQLLSEDLGFSQIFFYKKSTIGQIIFEIIADDYLLRITADNDAIYNIICGDYVLYRDNTILLTKQDLDDRQLENESAYYSIAKEIITANLKAPKTAEFPSLTFNRDKIAMSRNGDLIAVQSYVDAQNGFGALIRSDWLVEFRVLDIDTYSYEVVYMRIDNSTYGEYIDLN